MIFGDIIMSEILEYNDDESIGLAEALQKKAEIEASSVGMTAREIKNTGEKKYNEVRRQHAIEFINSIDEKLDALSNQSVANLLKGLIASGLSIEDEEELEYWINLLMHVVLKRFEEYFLQRSDASLWRQINFNIKGDLSKFSEEDIFALVDIIDAIKQINMARTKSAAGKKRINSFLEKIQKQLKQDIQTKTKENKGRSRRRSSQTNALELLKEKMSAEGIEQGGRYWNQVIGDFDMALDKESFARNWIVDTTAKNKIDVQKINELRGVENKENDKEEQRNVQREKEKQELRQKQEQEQKENVKNESKQVIEQNLQNERNRKVAQKYADKKQQKTGQSLTEKDIKMMKIKD